MDDAECAGYAGFKPKTYPEMNEIIKDILRRSEEPMNLYILARIEELEKQVAARQGKWTDPEDDDGGTQWHCSACSYVVKTIGPAPGYRYCPYCGARMAL